VRGYGQVLQGVDGDADAAVEILIAECSDVSPACSCERSSHSSEASGMLPPPFSWHLLPAELSGVLLPAVCFSLVNSDCINSAFVVTYFMLRVLEIFWLVGAGETCCNSSCTTAQGGDNIPMTSEGSCLVSKTQQRPAFDAAGQNATLPLKV